MKQKKEVLSLVLQGLFIAIVCVMTMAIQVPVTFTNGYIHMGDSCILLIAIFFGRKYGMIAGGVGSMLADIITGYAHWAIPTLIIKTIMGFVAGSISQYGKDNTKFISTNTVFTTISTIFVMVVGYFIGGLIIKGGALAAVVQSVVPNIIQGVLGSVIFFVVGHMFDKIKITNYIKQYVL